MKSARTDTDRAAPAAAPPSLAASASSPSLGATSASSPPAVVGRYRLQREIGRGGSGVVFEAADGLLQRPVAVKLLRYERADEARAQRALREARAAAKVIHPNVVAVLDAGVEGDWLFIAMELAPAGDAAAWLGEHGPLPWREATQVVADASRGLQAAHALGLVHRDVKPANLILLSGGGDGEQVRAAKLTDFGISREVDGDLAPLTADDRLVGTPHYMSPEQIRGESVDERSDVYSLGATYYTLLTAKLPFERSQAVQVLFAQCSSARPDPRTVDSTLPAGCATIVARAMAIQPSERYGSAAEMLADCERLLSGEPGGEALLQRFSIRQRSRGVAGSLLVVAGLMVVAALVGWWRSGMTVASVEPRGLDPVKSSSAASQGKELASEQEVRLPDWPTEGDGEFQVGSWLEFVALSGDGRRLAWGTSEGAEHYGQLVVYDLTRGRMVERYRDESRYAGFGSFAYTGEDGWLLGCRNLVMAKAAASEPVSQLLSLPDGSAQAIAVSTDGSKLLVGVDEWDEGGRVELVQVGREADYGSLAVESQREVLAGHEKPVRSVAWSQDGKWIASASEDRTVRIAEMDSVEASVVLQIPDEGIDVDFCGYSLALSADGGLVAAGGTRAPQVWRTRDREPVSLAGEHAGSVTAVAISSDSHWLASGSNDGIRLWELQSGKQVGDVLQGHESNVIVYLSFDPSGRWLYSAGFDRRIRRWDLRRRGLTADTP